MLVKRVSLELSTVLRRRFDAVESCFGVRLSQTISASFSAIPIAGDRMCTFEKIKNNGRFSDRSSGVRPTTPAATRAKPIGKRVNKVCRTIFLTNIIGTPTHRPETVYDGKGGIMVNKLEHRRRSFTRRSFMGLRAPGLFSEQPWPCVRAP